MENTATATPLIEEIPYADGSVGYRFRSPKSPLWFALFIVLGAPAGCTGGMALGAGLSGVGRDTGSNFFIGLCLIAFTIALFVFALRPTKRILVAVPGQGLQTSKGDLPFGDITDFSLKHSPAEIGPAGVFALSAGHEVMLAHCKTIPAARQLLAKIRVLKEASDNKH